MAREKLIILGTGTASRDLADLAREAGKFTPIGFLSDEIPAGEEIDDLPVLGSLEAAKRIAERESGSRPLFINGIGHDEETRGQARDAVAETGLPVQAFTTLIHPTTQDGMSPAARVSPYGVAILPHTTLSGGVRVYGHSFIGSNGSWGRDASLGAYGTAGAGVQAEAGAQAGEDVYLGTGSIIKRGRAVGDRSLIEPGAVVSSDIWPDSRVLAYPARQISPGTR